MKIWTKMEFNGIVTPTKRKKRFKETVKNRMQQKEVNNQKKINQNRTIKRNKHSIETELALGTHPEI